ncbi:ClpXP protease specificity-enhancing factor SspB [Moraxella nasovis]|uniref:ClpXP protease specificity-enhancing factor SspB n=1 Tax=Moraxella nasovis TaxID=2904121 RepID=UPI001F616803|nr:ClpXP protease specificity-enhancing factor SspB [Moraxella nasovis]UNU73075.1 ClpXP protease specificity-enhancing factor SspB [Moraxella nasovis]
MSQPKRPYMIRAMHEWLEDNEFTAYLLVDATHPDVVAPLDYAQDSRLVLAISYQATNNLQIDNDAISFAGRFGGVSQNVWIPMAAAMGIYAKEDPNEGFFFDPSEYDAHDSTPPDSPKNSPTDKKPTLRFVD